MSLQYVSILKTSHAPKLNTDGSYSIFSAEIKTLDKSEVAQIDTGLIISVPVGYYTMFIGGILQPSRLIETLNSTNTNNLSNDNNYKTNLFITLRNLSNNSFTINHGDEIARLIIMRIHFMDVKEVSNIEKQIAEPEAYLTTGSFNKWATSLLSKDPKCFDEYFNEEELKNINSFRNTDDYLNKNNASWLLMNFIYKNVKKENISKIRTIYDDEKFNNLVKPKKESKKNKKSNKKTEEEEEDED